MKVSQLAVSGDGFMLQRHTNLFQSISSKMDGIILVREDVKLWDKLKSYTKSLYLKNFWLPKPNLSSTRKVAEMYIKRSLKAEAELKSISPPPDLVLQIYGLFSPFWRNFDIPYVTYLDYTMALADRNWKPWAPFSTKTDLENWINCEKLSYQKASHIFTKSQCTKFSLMEDYGLPEDKITVVYSSGQFNQIYPGEKRFGSKQVLFNGSDFKRKGGDLLLEAFAMVRKEIPDAELKIVGSAQNIQQSGVRELGFVPKEIMSSVFLEADLLVAPSLCEPLGLFSIEAMNYGLPCIVANQDGMPELIEEGKNGYVLQNRDPSEFSEKIIQLLLQPDILSQMSVSARHKVKQQFTWDVVAEKMLSVIKSL